MSNNIEIVNQTDNYVIIDNFDISPDRTIELLIDEDTIDFKRNMVQLKGYIATKIVKKNEVEKTREDVFYTTIKGGIAYYNTNFGDINIIGEEQKNLYNIMTQVSKDLSKKFNRNIKFNSVLATMLCNGNDFINWRTESSRNLDTLDILIMNYGEPRELHIENKKPRMLKNVDGTVYEDTTKNGLELEKYTLNHGSIFFMYNKFNELKKYYIPKKHGCDDASILLIFFNMKEKKNKTRRIK